MDSNQLSALISLLDDEDNEVLSHVEERIISMGTDIIPTLEEAWENSFNPIIQKRLEDLIHSLQYDLLKDRLVQWKLNGAGDLLEGMWLISTYQYPDLDFSTLKKELEQIYYEAWLEFKPESHASEKVKILNGVLFNKLKFSANTKNFHSVNNSMINVVLESRKGNPITLCVIYQLVAQRLKMPIFGVNLPNLFILTYKDKHTQFYINAFNRGLIFRREDITNYINQLNLTPQEIFYQPCSHLDIICRVLRNLMAAYERIGEHGKEEEVKQLLYSISEHDGPLA